jgi:hypothetical protein
MSSDLKVSFRKSGNRSCQARKKKEGKRSKAFGFVDEDIRVVRVAPSIFDLITLRVYNTVADRKFDLGSRCLRLLSKSTALRLTPQSSKKEHCLIFEIHLGTSVRALPCGPTIRCPRVVHIVKVLLFSSAAPGTSARHRFKAVSRRLSVLT